MADTFHSGFISFVGRPNAGKSTLINRLVGRKVAITSRTAQTTRRPLRAILSGPNYQLIAIDTPGLHKPADPLGTQLNQAALGNIVDVDAVVMVVDASAPIGRGDEWVARRLRSANVPRILALNKTDRTSDAALAEQRRRAEDLLSWDGIFAVSARTGAGVEAFREALVGLLPEGPAWFPATDLSDQPLEVTMEEIVREKLLRRLREEVPHSVAVRARSVTYDERKRLWRIEMTIFVERQSQKAIIVGAKGAMIKQIGIEARADLEKLVDGAVFLDLTVDVKPHWRRDPSQIERFGYGLVQ